MGSRRAKVFEGHKCTTGIHNALLDVVMPEVSSNAWKVLCFIIRQTDGWNRDEAGIGYHDLMQGTGIKSRATIAAVLEELTSYRYKLLIILPGTQHAESTYAVNRDAEIEWEPQDFTRASSSKNELLKPSRSSKIELLSGSKNEPLKPSRSSKIELSYRKESNILKQEREEEPPVSPSVEAKDNHIRLVSPADDFDQPTPEPEWTLGERFILKACDLWEKPVVETDWKVKQAVRLNGKWVNSRLSLEKRIGGTPVLFREFWFNELQRKVNPRPQYVVEQWDAYDRWLIVNHETHRQEVA